ncbi:MAG TPA: TerD family protein [Burkholderiales bacterium]|nr:TerD family protein [Burkholderiales bacterium]
MNLRAERVSIDVAGTLVLGVHWTPTFHRQGRSAEVAADLDAVCELRDRQGRLLELVGPLRLHNANSSVLHTGDSRIGAGSWDDERLFVFVDALPENVASVVLSVESSNGHAFGDITDACCHVTDCALEEKLLSVRLAQLGATTGHVIATLERHPRGWTLTSPFMERG